MDSRWASEKIFQGGIGRRGQKKHQSMASGLLSQESSSALCLHPASRLHALPPSHSPPWPASRMSCMCYTVLHSGKHRQPHTLLGWHCLSLPASVPTTSWPLKLPLPPPGSWSAKTTPWGVRTPARQDHSRTLLPPGQCPRANVPVPPTAPSPVSLHTQQSLQPPCHTLPELLLTNLSS